VTWLAQSEHEEPTIHETEEDALEAAKTMKKPVCVWEED
jgi:hypothetical protein